MRRGDWLVYYSPTIEMGGAALRAFTAIGQVEGAEVYRYDMGGGFVPYRRTVRYADAQEVAIDMIKPRLEVCARPNWRIGPRRGPPPLEAADFATIAAAMGVRQARVGLE